MRVLVLGVLLAALVGPGCVVHTRAPAPELHVYGPPVVVSGRVRHVHDRSCGHPSRWHGGRWVYYVSGRWEYVEGGRLYVYRSVRSRPAAAEPARPAPARPGNPRGPAVRAYDPDDRRPRPATPGRGQDNRRDDRRPRPEPAR